MSREFASKVIWVWDDFVDAYDVVHRVVFTYDGPVAELKKGREAQQQITQQDIANAASNKTKQDTQYGAENKTLDDLTTTGPNGLSTAADARYASDLENINKTYGGLRTAGERGLAQRGFAAAPSGASSSLENSALQSQGAAETGSFENAQQLTREDQLAAMNARQGLQGIYSPNQPLAQGAQSALDQSQMGSTMGDIASGIMTAAPLVAAPFTGGASLAAYGIPGISRASGNNNTTGTGFPYPTCWIAETLWGVDDPRTHLVRHWLNTSFVQTKFGSFVMKMYEKYGRKVAAFLRAFPLAKFLFRPFFDRALSKAVAEAVA